LIARLPSRPAAALLVLATLGCDGSAGQATQDAGAEGGVVADAMVADAMPWNALSSSVAVLDFGCVKPDDALDFPLSIENRGVDLVGPLSVRLTPVPGVMLSLLLDACSGAALAAGEACRLDLFFLAPKEPRTIETTLTVNATPAVFLVLPVRARVATDCPP
jgi:hypothetical protein